MFKITLEVVKTNGKSKTVRDPKRKKLRAELFITEDVFRNIESKMVGRLLSELFANSIIKEWKKRYPRDFKQKSISKMKWKMPWHQCSYCKYYSEPQGDPDPSRHYVVECNKKKIRKEITIEQDPVFNKRNNCKYFKRGKVLKFLV